MKPREGRNIAAWHVIFACPFLSQFLHGNRVRPGIKVARLRRDKFPLFDVNMAGISGGYPRRDAWTVRMENAEG